MEGCCFVGSGGVGAAARCWRAGGSGRGDFRRHRRRSAVRAQIGGFVDENQFTLRNRRGRVRREDFDLSSRPKETHTHVFVRDEVVESLHASFQRQIAALREFGGQSAEEFVMAMRHVADPSWGTNRNRMPRHTRFVIVESEKEAKAEGPASLSSSSEEEEEEEVGDIVTTKRWLDALERVGDNLLRHGSHEVTFRQLCSHGDVSLGLYPHENARDMIVVTEMVNANWTSLDSVVAVSTMLQERAQQLVEEQRAVRKFVVLQSDLEPSFFKTVEYYDRDEDLIAHVQSFDRSFEDLIRPHKAAVNRVRQAFRIHPPV